MSNDRKDDDGIVISEEDVSYESPQENDDTLDPAQSSARGGVFTHGDSLADGDRAADDDDLAVSDQATQGEPSTAAGRFGPVTPGDPDDHPVTEHPVTEPVIPAGSRYGTSAQADSVSGLTTDADAIGTDAADVNGTAGVNGDGNGSAIPMPAATSAATPAAAAPAVSGATSDADWPQIQSLFVDDPHAAVKQAADVAGGALAALVAAANNREQTLRDSWQGDSTGTEDLRTALRDYRELAGRLSTLSKDL